MVTFIKDILKSPKFNNIEFKDDKLIIHNFEELRQDISCIFGQRPIELLGRLIYEEWYREKWKDIPLEEIDDDLVATRL